MTDTITPRYAFVKAEDETRSTEQILEEIVEAHPIELEGRLGTLSRPLVIECAFPGWQSRMWPPASAYPVRRPSNYVEGGVRYPAVVSSVEDQANELVAAIQAGCQCVHVHPRDPKDSMASHSVDLLGEVMERVFRQVDCITIQHTWKVGENGTIDYGAVLPALVERGGGNRLVQGAVVLWPPFDSYQPDYTRAVRAGVRTMENQNIKPVHKIRGSYHARKLRRDLIDSDVLKGRPLVLVHDMGHPYGWTMDVGPWAVDMITSLQETRERFAGEDIVLGVYPGGRNWLPIVMVAILMGVDLVRVGIEDTYWMYPHEDEVIQRNMDCVSKIIDFCKSIHRPVATVDDARKILGIVRT